MCGTLQAMQPDEWDEKGERKQPLLHAIWKILVVLPPNNFSPNAFNDPSPPAPKRFSMINYVYRMMCGTWFMKMIVLSCNAAKIIFWDKMTRFKMLLLSGGDIMVVDGWKTNEAFALFYINATVYI